MWTPKCLLEQTVVIIDKPTNHLDVETVEALGKPFAKFKVKPT